MAVNFGKYQGRPIAKIHGTTRDYLERVLLADFLEEFKEKLGSTIEGLPTQNRGKRSTLAPRTVSITKTNS